MKKYNTIKITRLSQAIGFKLATYRTLPLHVLRASSAGLMVAAVSVSSYAAQSTLIDATTTKISDTQTQMVFKFIGTPVLPKAYQLDNPSRLVLDMPKVINGLTQRDYTYQNNVVDSLTTLEGDDVTRIILTLDQHGDYQTQLLDDTLILNINTGGLPVSQMAPDVVIKPLGQNSGSDSTSATDAESKIMTVEVNPLLDPTVSNSVSQKAYRITGLSDLQFSPQPDGEADISVVLANQNIPVDVQRRGNKLIISLLGTRIPDNLAKKLNVSSSNTLVDSIVAYNDGNTGIITISQSKDFEYQAYQADNVLQIGLTNPVVPEAPKLEEKVYTGERLSMEFEDVEVRQVLQLLAEFTDMNLVASDSVNGRMTLRLMNVPWDQALDIILRNRGLDKRTNGNVIMVAPAQEIAAEENKRLEDEQKAKALAPLRTEYIQLNYAKADKIQQLIQSNRNSSDIRNGSLLSNRGTVAIDERTNTLIIQDVVERIEDMRSLIAKLDVPVKQVMIEARIVRATDSFSKELGVKWGILSNGAYSNRNLLVGGSDQTLWDLKEYDIESETINGTEYNYPSYSIERPSNLNVDLGVSGADASRIAFGLISLSDVMLDLELSALQADGKGEIIATPKVLTADKQQARIASGTQIPYRSASASGATTVEFQNAELSLEVTPSITPDGRIGMELAVNNDTPQTLSNGSIGIDTNRITTNVLVNDGQTVVLGGIFQNQINNSISKTPFLGDLPFVGRLFKKTINSNNKQELLIFVTPKLINDKIANINR